MPRSQNRRRENSIRNKSSQQSAKPNFTSQYTRKRHCGLLGVAGKSERSYRLETQRLTCQISPLPHPPLYPTYAAKEVLEVFKVSV